MKSVIGFMSFLLVLSCQGIPEYKEKDKALLMFRVDLSQSRIAGNANLSFFVDYSTNNSMNLVNGMNYLFLNTDKIVSIRFNMTDSKHPTEAIYGRSTSSFKLEAGKAYYLPYVTKYSDESFGKNSPNYRIGGQAIKDSELEARVKALQAEASDRGYGAVETVKLLTQSELEEADYVMDIYAEDK